jgi:drug/metabolite transporter (DMT)-like permease
MGPLLLFILSATILKEGLSLKTFIGIVIALIGSIIIIGNPFQGSVSITGDLLIVLSVFCTVIGILIYKPLTMTINPFQMTFMGMLIGVVPIALYSITKLHSWNVQGTSYTSIQGLIWSTLSIIIASFLFYYALRYKKAESVGVYQYLEPLSTIIAAWFLLGERITNKFAIGAVLVFVGVYVVEFLKPNPKHNSKV